MTKKEYSNATYNLHTFGLFNKDPYLAPGDPYVDPGADWNKSRHQGLNIVTRSGKTGLDATFDPKYKPLFSTGEYVEMDTLLEHQRVENGKKKISEKPFRPTSPTKWSSGKGSAYGYIGHMPPYLNDPYVEPSILQKKERDKGLNMVTMSGKTGSQATFGKKYEWIPDPYGGDEEKRTKLFGEDVKYNQSILRSRPSSPQGANTENLPSSHPRPATARPQSASRGGTAGSASDSITRRARPSSAQTTSDAHNSTSASWRSPLVSPHAFAPYGGPPRLFDTNVYRESGSGRSRPTSSTSRSSSASATIKHPRAFCGTSHTGRTFSKYPEHLPDPDKVILRGQVHSEKGFVPAGTTNHSMFTRPIMTHVTHK